VALILYGVVVASQGKSFDLVTQYQPQPAAQLDMFTAIGYRSAFSPSAESSRLITLDTPPHVPPRAWDRSSA
jgi:hypothetical protein